MTSKGLQGRVAIVTGASRGIGKAIALALADAGASIVVAARTVEGGGPLKGTIMETVKEIEAKTGKALAVKTNVGEDAEVENLVQTTLREMGRIDILVNNAAANFPRYFKDVTLKQWDVTTRITLRSVVVCTKAVLPAMMAQKYGHIINISSLAAVGRGDPIGGLAYEVSKAGVNRFTWGLAEEMKEYNVAVNALMPWNTATEGWTLLNPNADKTGWQTPEMWGKIVTFVATREPAKFTGKILTAEDIKPEMTKAGWTL